MEPLELANRPEQTLLFGSDHLLPRGPKFAQRFDLLAANA